MLTALRSTENMCIYSICKEKTKGTAVCLPRYMYSICYLHCICRIWKRPPSTYHQKHIWVLLDAFILRISYWRLFRVIWGWFHDTWGVERLGSWNLHQRKFIHSIKRDLPASARLWDVEGVNMYQETTNTKRFPTLSSVVFSRFHPVSGSLLHCHTFCECNLNMKQAWPIGLR